MYGRLSDHAHPNVVAALYHTVPLPNMVGEGLLYGGWYAPKSAGALLSEFARVELAFLRAFYRAYDADLRRYGLLFKPESMAMLQESGYDPLDPPLTMGTFLTFTRLYSTTPRRTSQSSKMTKPPGSHLASRIVLA